MERDSRVCESNDALYLMRHLLYDKYDRLLLLLLFVCANRLKIQNSACCVVLALKLFTQIGSIDNSMSSDDRRFICEQNERNTQKQQRSHRRTQTANERQTITMAVVCVPLHCVQWAAVGMFAVLYASSLESLSADTQFILFFFFHRIRADETSYGNARAQRQCCNFAFLRWNRN